MDRKDIIYIIIIGILIIIFIGIIVGYEKDKNQNIVEINTMASDEINTNSTENEQNVENTVVVEEISDEEKTQVEERIERVCTKWLQLPTFDDINDANKEWIYFHVETREDNYYVTQTQIEEELRDVFGPKLVIDVEKDTESADGYYIPKYDKKEKKYSFLPFGDTINSYYIINSIEKIDGSYIANLVEYSISRDVERNADTDEAVFAYDKSILSWKKVFELNKESTNEIESKVLEQKDKFQSYDVKLEKSEDGNIYIVSVESL